MRDSAERDPPPRCHPGTREKATEDIVRWIDEPNPSSTVLWVRGRAGVGKSALMQKIAELGLVCFGACFFFRRGTAGCNVKDRLFSTLAYQLAMNVPGMLEPVDQAMMRDFSLPKMSAAVQLKRLIIEPIRLLPTSPCPMIIIIIDGLDECEDFSSQHDILTLIGQVTLDPDTAIRFIIASRPEHQICEMFNKEPFLSRTRRFILDEGYDTAADIERYLRDKFQEIYMRNRDIMLDVKSPWPSKDDLEGLVWRASGQFIYAATVIKFVGAHVDFRTPQERLEIILHHGPMQASAFSELDRLYMHILSLYPDSEVLVHTLGMIIVLQAQNRDFLIIHNSHPVIAAITGLGEAKLHLVLRALQSITEIHTAPLFDDVDDIEPNGTHVRWLKLSHRSFYDFLTDSARSGPYFINEGLFISRILIRILELATMFIKECRR